MITETYFAPAQRAQEEVLRDEISFISSNPVIDCLMQTIAGLFAVLDEHRQIIAVNQAMLEKIGIDDASEVFGLRPGEALNCIHAHEEPNGCGTTKYCSSCGAAIAIVASMASNKAEERICAATIKKNSQEIELCFKVRSTPVSLDNRHFLLLFMQDITTQHAWAALEKTFFHDLNNILTGVLGTAELLALHDQNRETSSKLTPLLLRLKKEIDLQQTLCSNKNKSYEPSLQEISLPDVTKELKYLFTNHPAASNKSLTIIPPRADQTIFSDCSLLIRILTNMVTNALEATDEGGRVKFWIEQNDKNTTFSTWNNKEIPPDIQLRIFQRHFSTKNGEGRGIGTFSMKLFGEQFLRGQVNFTSSPEQGTIFRFSLPN